MVYGKVYKQKLQQYAITKRIGNGYAGMHTISSGQRGGH